MKKLCISIEELRAYIDGSGAGTYLEKIRSLFDEGDYLLFTYKIGFYGCVFHCRDGFYLERFFHKEKNCSSRECQISMGTYQVIEQWVKEGCYGIGDWHDNSNKLSYIRRYHAILFSLESKFK